MYASLCIAVQEKDCARHVAKLETELRRAFDAQLLTNGRPKVLGNKDFQVTLQKTNTSEMKNKRIHNPYGVMHILPGPTDNIKSPVVTYLVTYNLRSYSTSKLLMFGRIHIS